MSFYRLYFSDRDGHFSGVREMEADDDAQAIERADRMSRGFRRELWREQTLLRRWEEDAEDPPQDIRRAG